MTHPTDNRKKVARFNFLRQKSRRIKVGMRVRYWTQRWKVVRFLNGLLKDLELERIDSAQCQPRAAVHPSLGRDAASTTERMTETILDFRFWSLGLKKNLKSRIGVRPLRLREPKPLKK